jgi:hypothetical protein
MRCGIDRKPVVFIDKEQTMKLVLNILGGLIFLAGLVWFLQGINVLPGSFMTGDPQWAINGGIMMVVALVLFFFANRRRKP